MADALYPKTLLFFVRDQTRSCFVMKTNQMHCLSSMYFMNQTLHVLAMFIAHHQEVFTVYVQQLVRVKRLSLLAAGRVRMEHGNKHAQNM
jgi:hypothetical protein